MYGWVDALNNYLSGLDFPDETGNFARWWPADLHLIGKDIVRFHTVYWPAFLMSAGIALPKQAFAHGFVLNRGAKMSKPTGNFVEPVALADALGLGSLRYFLLLVLSFGPVGWQVTAEWWGRWWKNVRY